MGMYNTEPLTEFGVACPKGSSMTKQADANDCSIDTILKKFQKTGMIDHLAKGEGFYGDVSDMVNYQEALDLVCRANNLFMSMSPDVRERFDNNPSKMLSFLDNPNNYDEAVALGMVEKRPVVTPGEPKGPSEAVAPDAKP